MVNDDMSKKVIIRTRLPNPPEELVYCWREPYERFPVGKDGVVEGLSVDHPRFVILKQEWKLEVEPVVTEPATVKPVVAAPVVAPVAAPVVEKTDIKKEGVSQVAVISVTENPLVKEV